MRPARIALVLLTVLAVPSACAPSAPPAVPRAAASVDGAGGKAAPVTEPSAAPPPPAPSAPPAGAPSPGSARRAFVYVKAGRLFDGTGDKLRDRMAILIDGQRITRVAPASELPPPEGAVVVDLSRATVLPGLIDCHTHLAHRADHYDPIYNFKDTPFTEAFAAVVNAKATLLAGFTTVRDVGSPPFLMVDLRGAIDEGLVPGPRIVASGPGISMTGGHGDLNRFSPETHVTLFPNERDYAIADGVDQVRHVVRAQLKHGVDVIKVMASGGVLSYGDAPGAPQFSVEELRVIVEEAHAAGKKVAAHAHGDQAIKNALIAGVDSIEHGSFLDEAGIKLMKQKGAWLVADIYNDDFILAYGKSVGMPAENLAKEALVGRKQRENFAKAYKAGVKIAYGTDSSVYPHGDNGKQFATMVAWGVPAAAAIRSATTGAAELIGRAADVGAVVAGRYADLIAVDGDPLADVKELEHPRFVMKGGAVVKNELAQP